jgi:AraC family transcriptional regulator, glycine betaine-responsive activator
LTGHAALHERSGILAAALDCFPAGRRFEVDARVQAAIEQMEAQLDRPLRVNELAKAAGLSVAQFTRLFKRHTGTTPAAYLHARRMARARVLVERTSLSIREVMGQVGIGDRRHFARHFRLQYGFTPRTLRLLQRTRRCG